MQNIAAGYLLSITAGVMSQTSPSLFEQSHGGTAAGNPFQALEKPFRSQRILSHAGSGISKAYFVVWE